MLPVSPVASTVLVTSGLGTLLALICVGAFAALVIGHFVAGREQSPPRIDVRPGDPGHADAPKRLSA